MLRIQGKIFGAFYGFYERELVSKDAKNLEVFMLDVSVSRRDCFTATTSYANQSL